MSENPMEVSTFLNQDEPDDLADCLRLDHIEAREAEFLAQQQHAPPYVDCSDPRSAELNRKSRTAVLAYPAQAPGSERRFVEGLTGRVSRMYVNGIANYGFRIRHASFFNFEARTWLVLVSQDSLYFRKWHAIFQNLGAEGVRVYYVEEQHRRFGGKTSNGLMGVLDMFPHLDMDTLVENRVEVLVPLTEVRAKILALSILPLLSHMPSCRSPAGSSRRTAASSARASRRPSAAGSGAGRRASPRPPRRRCPP
jgi:hypothetical protein